MDKQEYGRKDIPSFDDFMLCHVLTKQETDFEKMISPSGVGYLYILYNKILDNK